MITLSKKLTKNFARNTQNILTKNCSVSKSTRLTQTQQNTGQFRNPHKHTQNKEDTGKSIPQRPTKREDCSMSKSTQLIKPGKPTCMMALNVNRTFLLMTTSKGAQDTLKSGDLIHGVPHKIAPRTIIAHIQLAQPSL